MPRTKLTVFSRFLLFMLIALPIIYVAASLYNGEDPVNNVRGWLGMNNRELLEERYEAPAATDAPADMEAIQQLRSENEQLREALARCQNTTGS
ncbi:hypothetical protein CLV84_2747 [Neolewinella xylanilytica]|uniref:Uncharacterized protein n=1 Tax=Neolewinella xylanilytica TaxID=1514080 RepID=A0A2S6I3V0_9BACT|nr:hypothetical protein [Neolewinella xylanilytica]PPK85840.1 hypothetical protein CLV84_2747 [Neolewinella xylanilytica]